MSLAAVEAVELIALRLSHGRLQRSQSWWVMLVSVTPLGSATGDVGAAVAAVLDYLDGRHGGRRGSARAGPVAGPDPMVPPPGSGAVGYYADSVEGPGRWVGRGVAGVQMSGEVSRQQLARLLGGQDPRTDAQWRDPTPGLVASRGTLTLPEAAQVVVVSERHMRRLASQSRKAEMRRLFEVMAGTRLSPVPRSYLAVANNDQGQRVVEGVELTAWQHRRRRRPVVIGFDVTFSAPKSVSILWAAGDDRVRSDVLAAIDAAVDAGMTYLEGYGARVRRSGRVMPADGVLAASYLHGTSRAMDPQLHRHVVVGNMASGGDGEIRALDSRCLFDHAKTAGYVAGAELRWQLTDRLGVDWEPVVNGLADVAGVSREAIVAMSTRSVEVEQAAATLGLTSAKGRQMAAYASRAAKDKAADPEALRPWWRERLAEHGFDDDALAACLDRSQAVPLTPEEEQALLDRLGSATGVTEFANTFDRRHVLQWLTEHTPRPVSAEVLGDLADKWLASEAVVPLDPATRRDQCDPRGRRVAVGAWYTTPEMIALETAVGELFGAGLDVGAGTVDREVVATAIARRPTIGADQAGMVRAITTSGHRVQCVVGPAGSGKTFALEVAAWAWTQAGYRVIGAAVQGTAAEVLGRAAGIPSSTVASLLWRLDTTEPGRGPLDRHTVVVVDEASTIGTRDLHRLLQHVETAGAAIRLVGDPAQHSAVTAGGAWRWLVDQHPEVTPTLTELRRQAAPQLGEVRLAFADYREGRIREAIERLDRDQRIVTAATADDLLDQLVADWYLDRRTAVERGVPASSMVAEHHRERVELNRRARALLAADGTLTGPALTVADTGVEFRASDEVIARIPDRTLRPAGGDRHSHVRNGTRGRVVEVLDGGRGLVVDFDARGSIVVPTEFLTRRLPRRRAVGGLVHAYALTSHAAQGDTYEAGRHLATDRSTRKGVYVGLTRGRSEVRLYTVAHGGLDTAGDLDRMPHLTAVGLEGEELVEVIAERLQAGGEDRLVTELDEPTAAIPDGLRGLSLRELDERAEHDPLAGAARRLRLARIKAHAVLHPPEQLVARLGPRPEAGPVRRQWDAAVGADAVHYARWTNADPSSADPRQSAEQLAAILDAAEVTVLAARHPGEVVAELAAGNVTVDRARRLRDALARRVDAAVRHPAPYLYDLLGPPPAGGDQADRWEEVARRVERYRHEVLGLAPSDGPLHQGSSLDAVVGPIPGDPVARRQYRTLVAHVQQAGRTGQQRLHLSL